MGKILKRYCPLFLNVIIIPLIFLIPVYSLTYVDELDKINYIYNFYDMFNINVDKFFAVLGYMLVIFCSAILIIGIIFLINNYKLIRKRFFLEKFVKILCVIIFVVCILMLIRSIVLASKFSNGFLTYYGTFYVGTIILLFYSIVQNFLIFNCLRRVNGKTF